MDVVRHSQVRHSRPTRRVTIGESGTYMKNEFEKRSVDIRYLICFETINLHQTSSLRCTGIYYLHNN